MKAVALTGVRQMEMAELPDPQIRNEDDVLLKIEMVGVCGSDVHYYETGRIGSQVVEYPYVVGHECAATVKAVGKAVRRVKVGDRIVVDPAMACHHCDQCLAGRENTCRNLKFLGCPGQTAGCLSEYIVMPEQSCFPVSGNFSLERAVLCEPLAIGYYAVRQARLIFNHNIGILGAGPIGLSCMVSAGIQSIAGIYITEKIDERVDLARKNSHAWVGNPLKQDIVSEILKQQPQGLDAVFECAGKQETIDQAVDLLKPGGKLMLIGIPRYDRISLNIDKTRRKEITIINVRRQNHCTLDCIGLIKAGKIDPDFMVTHKFGFERTKEAFDLVAEYRDGVVKALIEF